MITDEEVSVGKSTQRNGQRSSQLSTVKSSANTIDPDDSLQTAIVQSLSQVQVTIKQLQVASFALPVPFQVAVQELQNQNDRVACLIEQAHTRFVTELDANFVLLLQAIDRVAQLLPSIQKQIIAQAITLVRRSKALAHQGDLLRLKNRLVEFQTQQASVSFEDFIELLCLIEKAQRARESVQSDCIFANERHDDVVAATIIPFPQKRREGNQ